MRIALGIEYDGSQFSGWQAQRHAVRTIQACVEAAVSTVAAHPIRVQCAGRTDAGVHACGQVVHFDTEASRSSRSWTLGTNANLPQDISVCWAEAVPVAFHARFSAVARSYRYVIANRATRGALWANKMAWEHRPLEVDAMTRAVPHLLGEHDFPSVRAAGCQAHHAVRTIRRLRVLRDRDLVLVEVEANGFLQHMVRNIVGTLLVIGRGEQPPEWLGRVLAARDRSQAAMTAPPGGLYLTHVDYPGHFQLPTSVWQAHAGGLFAPVPQTGFGGIIAHPPTHDS